jgi:hypothetical protein
MRVNGLTWTSQTTGKFFQSRRTGGESSHSILDRIDQRLLQTYPPCKTFSRYRQRVVQTDNVVGRPIRVALSSDLGPIEPNRWA